MRQPSSALIVERQGRSAVISFSARSRSALSTAGNSWFATKWARQEKEIRKIIDSTQGMYGDLQAVTGRSLMEVPTLEASLARKNQG